MTTGDDELARLRRIEDAARAFAATVKLVDRSALHLREDEAGVGYDRFALLLAALDPKINP